MWEYQSEDVVKEQIVKYTLASKGETLTLAQVIELLKFSRKFRSFYNGILKDCSFEAFFWETPAATTRMLTYRFEFVVVKSEFLSRIKPDAAPFQHYFASNREVVHFSNLGKDAYLIVPCPVSNVDCYTHLAAFVRRAPEKQTDTFWRNVGELYENKLTHQPIWLSTAGLGVSWLHLRIDSTPKYYCYSDYKTV